MNYERWIFEVREQVEWATGIRFQYLRDYAWDSLFMNHVSPMDAVHQFLVDSGWFRQVSG